MQVTTDNMVLFWQHDTIYSNWYEFPGRSTMIVIDGISFKNSEAAFMAYKAAYFDDNDAIKRIVESTQWPKDMKAEGRTVKNFTEENGWLEDRLEIMYDVCLEKFSQNETFKSALIATGNRTIVEGSPYDTIWGIGLRADDPLALDSRNWKGLNLLGIALMRVRDTLRASLYERVED